MLGWKGDYEPKFPEPSSLSGILLRKGDEKMEKLRRKKKLASKETITFRLLSVFLFFCPFSHSVSQSVIHVVGNRSSVALLP